MSTRYERAVDVLISSIESSAGLRESYEAAHTEVVSWLEGMQMFMTGSHVWRGHRDSHSEFDTLQAKLGAIWWPELEDGKLLPVICGVQCGQNKLSIRLAMIRVSQGQDFAAVGVRFETSEGEGPHDFHHAQLFAKALKHEEVSRLTSDWTPEVQPSFPLRADNPLELVWALAVAVYGKQRATEPFKSLREEDHEELTRYIRELK